LERDISRGDPPRFPVSQELQINPEVSSVDTGLRDAKAGHGTRPEGSQM